MTVTAAPTAIDAPRPPRSRRGDLIGLLTEGDRPPVDPKDAARLDTAFRAAIADVFDNVPPAGRLYVGTHQLDRVAQCEGLALAEMTDTFHWSLPAVRRGLAIEAIRTWVARRRRVTVNAAATEALRWATRGGAQHSISELNRGAYLQGLDAHTRSGLVADIAAAIAAYDVLVDPDVDARDIRFTQRCGVRTPHAAFRASVDLICGRSRPDDTEARKLLIGFSLGDRHPALLAQLHRAALYDTIGTGVPPRRCAAVSLDPGGDNPVEIIDVTPELLWETAREVVSLTARHAWLAHRRHTRRLQPGGHCEACPNLVTCPAARTHDTQRQHDARRPARFVAPHPAAVADN